MKTARLVCLALVLPGCTCGVNLDGLRFFCSQDSECGAGMVCRNKECVSEGTGGGAGGGGGTGGGGGGGGGGGTGGGSGGGDGGVCVVDGGTVQTSETLCSDGKDNDCDGLVDCAETQCNTLPCGANGRSCSGVTCACSGNGGVSQTFESLCTDGKDNDCDGRVDCADPTCEGRACGVSCSCIAGVKAELACTGGFDDDSDGQLDCADSDCAGRSCGTGCVCSGAVPVETACGNGADDDGDGMTDCADSNCCVGCPMSCEVVCDDGLDDDGNTLTDCADSKCRGRTCGPSGRVCNGSSCACSGNGGISQATESSCFDAADNDCDGLVDCADPDCQAGTCTCEVDCKDGVDNDCNGAIDCADPKCLRLSCSATLAASVCCSTAASAIACRDLGTDEANCGGCGLACASNRTCVATDAGTKPSGRCDCSNSGMCPASQSCSSVCRCSSSLNCASGQSCTAQVCAYP